MAVWIEKKTIALLFLYRRRLRRSRKTWERIYWIHPYVAKRRELGDFYTKFMDLREHEDKFFIYFRMSIKSFDELHERLKPSLQKKNTAMRDCIEPIQMLCVTLRYLASGCTFTDLHLQYRLGISTISGIVKDVCSTIWCLMLGECIPPPTKDKWESISPEFETRANFPHCIGAVDGKHIRISNPLGSMYYNYKGYSSVVLMAVADANYRFVYVDIGSYGKDCDSSIFKRSSLWTSIINNDHEIPIEKNCYWNRQLQITLLFRWRRSICPPPAFTSSIWGISTYNKKKNF
ncbi:unnamed protein product [Acanthoscelides obtectus]|uniref:DDE Tnp4 domain-containing protein n=1 Tax=Acanthoscelides obtectus TaxID=200917 RepID=A0A9P0M6V8_ACAOB|nr:unnamed protein product [Acanthoscelides obtectus]CAK1635364.1 hypothetical protein AOBTE_LOCUS9233 [Acanthoscelides obtectus]